MKILKPTALAGLAVTLVALAGCGSSSDTLSAADKKVGAQTSTSASADAIPTEDVVSSVQTVTALHDKLPAAVRSSGVLTLGTTLATGEAGLPHVGSDSANKQVGLDVDLRDAVAKVLGVSWKISDGSFETIVPGVQSGKYDVGQDNFAVTSARLPVVDFATYLKDGQGFVAAKNSSLGAVTKLTDVCGHTVSTGTGSSFQQILDAGVKECSAAGLKPYTPKYYSDNASILLGLQNGQTDLYFGPTLGDKYLVAHQPNLKFLGEVSSTDVGFVTAKGSPLAHVLVDAVNELIHDGTYEKIFAKWGVAGSGISQSEFNPKPAF
ncbi:ABC transporter substrate-binding protein [Nocardioides sp. BP30]|uniref:ABC transporter substrate-binding protein n=1 Tax=Nocardioides sp. BP30 TaxID=3036374 RepID=UPI0024683AC6|nr:ABC transporter substrate-binding protein [Nocardioides sp. BP30]WGL53282.1 ABC transporter substrate-binding protein [Nocardioides sp. BP30]